MDERQPTSSEGLGRGGEGGTEAAPQEASQPMTAESQESNPTEHLMEELVERDNLNRAYFRVVANKGSAGVDGMSVDELLFWCRENGKALKASLLTGTYQPAPVRGVQIPKPGGGKRQLGIPTAVDRMVQQAILQVLSPILDSTFSESSFGFRPGRSAHDALFAATRHISEGYTFVVDIDLEKFFDRVNHDMLMARLARHVKDKRLLKIVRAFLNTGLMQDGVVHARREGTPQGGPLSPLLANLMLDDLDKELEKRGHRFVRYADDCNIYIQSQRAGERVMTSLRRFIEDKLKLRVNEEKSAVAPVNERSFLGYRLFQERSAWDIDQEYLPF
jgi:RNA-directed DNA polymerase